MSNTTDMSDVSSILRPAVSCTIAAAGTLTNTLSLSYFLRNRRDKQDLDMLLLLHNVFDLIVCVAASAVNILYQLTVRFDEMGALEFVRDVSVDFFTAAIQCAGFTTLMLSVTRLLVLWKPFRKLRVWAVRLVMGAYVLFMVVSSACLHVYYYRNKMQLETNEVEAKKEITKIHRLSMSMDFSNLALIILFVFIFNIISMTLLAVKNKQTFQGDDTFRHAAVTVLMLSILFISLYTMFVVRIYVCILSPGQKGQCNPNSIRAWFATWVALPLNSALNPAIYFIRAENMRNYLRKKFRGGVRSISKTWSSRRLGYGRCEIQAGRSGEEGEMSGKYRGNTGLVVI